MSYKPYIFDNVDFYKRLRRIEGFDCSIGDVYLYSDDKKNMYLLIMDYEFENNLMACYSLQNQAIVTNGDIEDNLHPATRKEIKTAGLWDYVTNKDDYSSEEDKIETELDEYLRIGEEIEKERQIK